MDYNFDASELRCQGVDSCQTIRGSMYFAPMSQERLETLDKRPDFKENPFDQENGYPNEGDAHMIQDVINEQLRRSEYKAETEEDYRGHINSHHGSQSG